MRGRGARASAGTAPGVGHPAGPRLPPVVQRAGRRGTPAVQRLVRHVTPAVQRLGRGGAARARRANLRARLPRGQCRTRPGSAQAVQRGSGARPAWVRTSRSARVRVAPGPGPRASRSARRGRAPQRVCPGASRPVPPRPSGPPDASAAQRAGRGGLPRASVPQPPDASAAQQAGRGGLPRASAARRLSGPAGGVPTERSSGAALQRRPCSVVRCRGRRRSSSTGGPLSGLGFALSGSPEGPRIPQRPPLGRGPRPGRRPGSVRRGGSGLAHMPKCLVTRGGRVARVTFRGSGTGCPVTWRTGDLSGTRANSGCTRTDIKDL